DDALVLSVIKAVHKNFASYEIYLTADVDVLVVASNQKELPKPDWSVYKLPDVAHDLRHFSEITPDALESTRLITREALAPLIEDATGANSDFYPLLDLGTEQTRYEKRFASGWAGLADDRFDLSALLTSRRYGPT